MKNRDLQRINTQYKPTKVLVVEDSDDQWVLLQKATEQILPAVRLDRVTTAAQALDLLEEWTGQEWELPQLILLDLYLPDSRDGWALLAQFKSRPAPFSLIPIVMLTGSASQTDINQAYGLGASAYLVKPTEFEGWLSSIQELRSYWWETVALPPLHYSL